LLSFFVLFMVYIFSIAKPKDVEVVEQLDEKKKMSKWKSVIYILLWLFGLAVWGKWIVDWAVHIATVLWVSQSMIGLTIVAIWTSLPELATSAMAAYKKQADIAIGNVIWSNIFNLFWVLWLSAVIRPLAFSHENNPDILMTIGASLFLFLALFIGKKHIVQRRQGIMFVLMYISYITFLIVTQW
jgi:cation:H+ antiporter